MHRRPFIISRIPRHLFNRARASNLPSIEALLGVASAYFALGDDSSLSTSGDGEKRAHLKRDRNENAQLRYNENNRVAAARTSVGARRIIFCHQRPPLAFMNAYHHEKSIISHWSLPSCVCLIAPTLSSLRLPMPSPYLRRRHAALKYHYKHALHVIGS